MVISPRTLPNGRLLVQTRFRLHGLICPDLGSVLYDWAAATPEEESGLLHRDASIRLAEALRRESLDRQVGFLRDLLRIGAEIGPQHLENL